MVNETGDEVQLCKAIVANLPKECKKLNEIGKFGITLAKSYDCMFPNKGSEFDEAHSARVLVLLKRLSKHDLVNEVSKKWVEKRRWGPLRQQVIVNDLKAVLDVKRSLSASRKEKISLSDMIVLKTFKDLLFVGRESIAPNRIYLKLLPRLTAVYSKVSLSESDLIEAVRFGLNIILRFSEDEVVEIPSKKIENLSDLANVVALVENLNSLAQSGKIDGAAWDKIVPLIVNDLNAIYDAEFAIVEEDPKSKKTKKGKRKDSDESSEKEEETETSSESTEQNTEEENRNKDPATSNNSNNVGTNKKFKSKKIIKVSEQTLDAVGTKLKFKSKRNNKVRGSDEVEASGFPWMTAGLTVGAAVLLAGIGYAGYLLFVTRRNRKDFESDI